MDTIYTNKLKNLFGSLRSNRPMTSAELHELNISADLLVYYVKAGWLKRLANGVYAKPNAVLELNPCLNLLQQKIKGLHVGGKSALELYGYRHYLNKIPLTRLYAWDSAKLPDWFLAEFNADVKRKRLFHESPEDMLNVSHFNNDIAAPLVSEPERAVLEMLSDIPSSQEFGEAEEIMESALNFRAEVMSNLLHQCENIKTVRLFLKIAAKHNLSVYEELKHMSFPTGSNRNWVHRKNGKTLILKP